MKKTTNRLHRLLKNRSRKKDNLFCAFLTLGYPSLTATGRLIKAFEGEGVDIIELGFPFSDPMADGPTIQHSSQSALDKGVRLEDAFRLVKKLRREGCKVPILLFTYLNPVFHYGLQKFARRSHEVGFDGLIIPDLPPGEEIELEKACAKQGLSQVYFIAPTTARNRAKQIARRSTGFIYYISLKGVTGARKQIAPQIRQHLASVRRLTNKPLLVGFGVSNSSQARTLSRMASGVIVGSAIINELKGSSAKIDKTVRFVRQMVRATKRQA